MLRMDQVYVVRHKALVEGQSIRSIAREMGVGRNTVRKYLQVSEPIRAHIKWLQKELSRTDNELDEAVEASTIWKENETLLRSVPGVGPVLERRREHR